VKNAITLGVVSLFALGTTACGKSERVEKLQEAFAKSKISLVESMDISSSQVPNAVVGNAELNVDIAKAAFQVRSVAADGPTEVTVDPARAEISSVNVMSGGVATPCPGSISVAEAVKKAEQAASGRGALVEMEGCEFEVQVLEGDTLWEVEVAPDGRVLEKEEWDEEEEDD